MTEHPVRLARGAAEGRATILKRRELDEVGLSAEAQARLDGLFGPGSTPAGAVDRIVDDVRSRGDDALRDWTQRLDGYDPFPAEVSRKEIQAAYESVDQAAVASLTTAETETPLAFGS